jgi:hypothetical protein
VCNNGGRSDIGADLESVLPLFFLDALREPSRAFAARPVVAKAVESMPSGYESSSSLPSKTPPEESGVFLGGGSRQWRVWGVCGGSDLVGGSFQKAPGGLEGGSPRRQISGANAKRVEIERMRTNPAQISLTNHTMCFSHIVDGRWAPFFCPPHGHWQKTRARPTGTTKSTLPPFGHWRKTRARPTGINESTALV